VTAVVGVSGSGKSTLLRLLAGQELPTGGTVRVEGRELAHLDARGLRRLRRGHVAYVSQRPADNLFPHLTLSQHGVDAAMLELLGVAGRANARAGELSGGELARAAFAVALSRPARLVVVDEPTAELDRATASVVLAAMRDAARRGTAFVVATHDPDVLAFADVVVELGRARGAPARAAVAPPSDEVALTAVSLTRSYGGVPAVREASLELHAGELGAVVGRSGSGKSTLLMLLAGWQEPDAGRPVRRRPWRELAFVPQRFGLVPELTVRENLDLPSRLGRLDGRELVGELALDGLADRYPHQISIGQQQRVALARALAVRPRVLLVDEPTSHQDGASAERVWSVLAAAAAEGTACLVATHEPDAARRAHTAWELADGRLRLLA